MLLYYCPVMFCFLRVSESQIHSKEILNHHLCLYNFLLKLSAMQTASQSLASKWAQGLVDRTLYSLIFEGRNKTIPLDRSCITAHWIFIWCILALCRILIRKSEITWKGAGFNYQGKSSPRSERSSRISLCQVIKQTWCILRRLKQVWSQTSNKNIPKAIPCKMK